MPMSTQDYLLLVQDLADILQLNRERVAVYNKSAYYCSDMTLKMLLNRELDNSRDNILAIKRLLMEHFGIDGESENHGELFGVWTDFKPSFDEADMNAQLLSFERADLLTLHCYHLLLSRAYVDITTRNLIEFCDLTNVAIYHSIKKYRENFFNRQHGTNSPAYFSQQMAHA